MHDWWSNMNMLAMLLTSTGALVWGTAALSTRHITDWWLYHAHKQLVAVPGTQLISGCTRHPSGLCHTGLPCVCCCPAEASGRVSWSDWSAWNCWKCTLWTCGMQFMYVVWLLLKRLWCTVDYGSKFYPSPWCRCDFAVKDKPRRT